jgi:hypothetical protein
LPICTPKNPCHTTPKRKGQLAVATNTSEGLITIWQVVGSMALVGTLAHPHRCHGANTTQTRCCRRVVPKRAERAPKGYQKGTKTNRIHPAVLQAVATNVTTHARFITTYTFPTICRLINTIHEKRGEKKPKKLLINRPQPHVSLGIPHPRKNIFIANQLLYSALRNKFRNLRKKYLPE